MNIQNVHGTFTIYIYTYIEHRNVEIRKTLNDFSVQVRNLLLPLSKCFDIRKRDTHSFYSGFFICPQHVWHSPQRSPRASESQPSRSVSSSQLTDVLEISQNPPRSSSAWRHLHSVTPLPMWAIVTSLSDTSAWTPVLLLHLTNPCAEPKGSQPN